MFRGFRLASGGALLFLALIAGIATAVTSATWLREHRDATEAEITQQQPGLPMEYVLVAIRDLPAGLELSAPMVRVVEVPVGSAPAGVLRDADGVAGKTLRYPLAEGEQVLESKLVGIGTGNGLAFSVPPGMRGVSVAFSEVMGAGGLLVPGDRVDVLVATSYERLFEPGQLPPESIDGGHPTVLTVLQDVTVLAVGQVFTPPVDSGRDPFTARVDDGEAQPGARSVTLAVSPAEAQTLFMATQQGVLGLALRAFGDDSPIVLNPEFKLNAGADTALGLASAVQ